MTKKLYSSVEEMANDLVITDATIINDIGIQGGSSNSPWEPGDGEGSAQLKDAACRARGVNSVAEGYGSETIIDGVGEHCGDYAHAEGIRTSAVGAASHAEGGYTRTNNPCEHAEGRGNVSNQVTFAFGNAGNTIHSVGIGGTQIGTFKNAFEIMQNGDAYMIGVGGYDGTNYAAATRLQDAIGGSGLITVAQDVDLVYDNTEFFASIISVPSLNDYKTNPHRYNLIIEVHGQREDTGEFYGYTANHFCYMRNQEGQFMAMCHDDVGEGISHDTQFVYGSEGWSVVYSGFSFTTEGQALPETGSKVSIYLQKFA